MSPLPLSPFHPFHHLIHQRSSSSSSSSTSSGAAYPALVPLLAGLFGGLLFVCLVGLAWCVVRRKKHRAPVIPYHLHTRVAPPPPPFPPSSRKPAEGSSGSATDGEVVPPADPGQTERVEATPDGQRRGAKAENKKRKEKKRPPPLGQEGRGVGYGFNPVFGEAYGGGGGLESGEAGGLTAQRVGPMWG